MDMRHNAPFSKIEPAGRLGQWRRGFLLAAVAVLALAASLVMTPAPAEAQRHRDPGVQPGQQCRRRIDRRRWWQ